jgi:two-component system sensor histidine kinase KdpD
VQPKLEWCDVRDLVQTTVHILQRELSQHPVQLELQPGLALARLDFTLTQQALSNLLLNAVVHTPPGSPITVQARAQPGLLVLSVADRGSGLAPDLLPRIFDKFIRAPQAPAGGSGLGLAIVKGFIEAQGGRVTAENRPDSGAIFTLRLPQTQPPPAVAAEVS